MRVKDLDPGSTEKGFFHKMARLSLRARVRRELEVESLLLCIERIQLSWLGHLSRMPPGHLSLEGFCACHTGRRP